MTSHDRKWLPKMLRRKEQFSRRNSKGEGPASFGTDFSWREKKPQKKKNTGELWCHQSRAQHWQQSEAKTIDNNLVIKRAPKKPLLSKKTSNKNYNFAIIKTRLMQIHLWWIFWLFWTFGKSSVQRGKWVSVNVSHCVVPTLRHPDTIHVWGCLVVSKHLPTLRWRSVGYSTTLW